MSRASGMRVQQYHKRNPPTKYKWPTATVTKMVRVEETDEPALSPIDREKAKKKLLLRTLGPNFLPKG